MSTVVPELLIKKESKLEPSETKQMVDALFREFKLPTDPQTFNDKLFFLYKSGEEVLAMGGLWEVKPFVVDGREYVIHGVVEVISNVKGNGYGKVVVSAIRDYMIQNNLNGFGFCMSRVKGFYQKCGFSIAEDISQRFIYRTKEKDITNQNGQIIFYQDGPDKFMKYVLANSEKEILIPTDGLW